MQYRFIKRFYKTSCAAPKASLVQREVSAEQADGGIVGTGKDVALPWILGGSEAIPQSKIKDFCQPPLHKGAFFGRLSTARFLLPILPPGDMIKEKAVNNMIEKDDWRLTAGPVLGNKEKLKNIPLYYIPFQPLSENWDHEHCAFCWAKFYLHEECLQEGYCTRPQNSRDADWICPECYEDFKEMFGWTLKKGSSE